MIWVARDKDGDLYGYDHKPQIDEEFGVYFMPQNNLMSFSVKIENTLFPNLKFGDEPIQAEF